MEDDDDDVLAHICIYANEPALEIHIDIRSETDEPVLDLIPKAFIDCFTELRKQIDANPRSAPIQQLH